METDKNMTNFNLDEIISETNHIKQNKEKIRAEIEVQFERQNKLMEEIYTIIADNKLQNKKEEMENYYNKEHKKFNSFNTKYKNMLKKYAFISKQQTIIENIVDKDENNKKSRNSKKHTKR